MPTDVNTLRTLVIADDDQDICDLVEMQMTRMGFRVVTAHDGQAALSAIISERPSLAILDVMMPLVNGFDVVRGVRAHDSVGKTKIIVFSAKSREGDATFLKEHDVHYIAKPFSPSVLAKKVIEILGPAEESDPRSGV